METHRYLLSQQTYMERLRTPATSVIGAMVEGLRSMEASQSDALTRDVAAFSLYLNALLAQYDELSVYLPLAPDNLFESLRDGVILGFVLNHYYPGCLRVEHLVRGLDLGQINQVHTKVVFEVNANLNLVVNAAKSVKNLVVVNLGAEDILQCRRDLVLGLLWQIFNTKLASAINLQAHPELVLLAEGNESLATLAQLKSEALLNRWFNFHLKRAGTSRRVTSLGRDISDSELYALLLHQIAPTQVSLQDVEAVLSISAETPEGRLQRAEIIIEIAVKLGCNQFASPQDIVHGHQRLNFAFTASLFNEHIGIALPSEDEIRCLRVQLEKTDKQVLILEEKLQVAEAELLSSSQQYEQEQKALQEKLSSLQNAKKQELEEQQIRFDIAKEELAAQYKDSLESALEAERRAHQNEMWELLNRQKDVRRQLLTVMSMLRQQCSAEELERAKVSDGLAEESVDLELIIKLVSEMAAIVSRKVKLLESTAENLKTTVAHKEKVNEIMGDKIREYTELVISGKKTDTTRRGSLLKRLFTTSK